jgi:hypothetical protein
MYPSCFFIDLDLDLDLDLDFDEQSLRYVQHILQKNPLSILTGNR